MKRIVAFPVVGPLLGMSAFCSISVIEGNWDFHDAYIPLGFLLVLSAIGGLVDAALSRVPASFRVLLTAMSGIGVCEAMVVIAQKPLTAMPVSMAICAVCMGVCSWLSDGSIKVAQAY